MIRETENKELAQRIRELLHETGGYCPCAITKTEDDKCPCKDFRDMDEGVCNCGLYFKTKEDTVK